MKMTGSGPISAFLAPAKSGPLWATFFFSPLLSELRVFGDLLVCENAGPATPLDRCLAETASAEASAIIQ